MTILIPFIDIPHTVFVHPGIFRIRRNQKLTAEIKRSEGRVEVVYQNETDNLGFFSKFLNPKKQIIEHYDRFYMPNITSVEYFIHTKRHFIITSQSIPISEDKTMVYTDLTYNYGIWNRLAAPLIRYQAQKIIGQDQVILDNQRRNIDRFGENFQNSPADMIHVMVSSIRDRLEKGHDPRALTDKTTEVEFWV